SSFEPVKDVEWPIHGQIRIFDEDDALPDGRVEYVVRFAHGRVAWIRRVRLEPSAAASMASAAAAPGPRPEAMGRPASREEFRAAVPRKLELVDGHVYGEEKLLLLLLSTMGLRRAAALIGREAWIGAVEEEPDGNS